MKQRQIFIVIMAILLPTKVLWMIFWDCIHTLKIRGNNDRTRIEDIAGMFTLRGQENLPAVLSLLDACDMWEEIGRDRIDAYVSELSSYLKKRIREVFGESVSLFAPDIPELSSGLTSFNPFPDMNDKKKVMDFTDRLKRESGYVVRFTEFHLHNNDPKQTFAIRVSTHLFHDRTQIEPRQYYAGNWRRSGHIELDSD